MDYGIGYKVPLIVRILSRLKNIIFKGFNLNKAYTNIGNLKAKTSKIKPLTYITFLYNISKVILKLNNLIEGTSDLRGVGYSNNSNNNGGQYSGSSSLETAAFLNNVRVYRNIL